MKKALRIIALSLVLVIAMGVFASCGKTLSGKYEATFLGTGTVLEFDGNKVKASFVINALVTTIDVGPVEGTYTIKDDKITFDFVDESGVKDETAKKALEGLKGELAFEEGDGYIKIGDTKFTAVKK